MKCKKMIIGILSLTLALFTVSLPPGESGSMTAVTAAAEEETLNPGIQYKNCGDHIEITGYDGSLTDRFGAHLIIPDTIEDLPVTKICPAACKGISQLYEVWLPIDLKEIGDEAFAECKNLTRIHFALTLRTIGKRAFYNCGYMGTLTLPDTVEEIGVEAFAGCSRLDYVILPDRIRKLQRGVFADTGIVSVSLPASVERIENRAFSGCKRLSNICYKGSADAWAVLSIGSGNECLNQAELLCDYNKQKVERSCIFDPDKDTWGFLNKDVAYYVLSEESLAEMTSNMTVWHGTQTKSFWKENQEMEYQGACVGLAMTSLLTSAGIIDPSELDPDAKCLHDVKLTDKVRELITYYQMLQGNDSFIDMDIWASNKLEYYLEQGVPVFFWYQGSYTNEKGKMEGFGHAVVAYGIEEGRFEFDGNVFKKKILTYDNNITEESGRDGNIYLEPENTEWNGTGLFSDQMIYIPYMNEHENLKVIYNPSAYNLDLLNLHGKNKGVTYAEPEQKCALLRTPALPAGYRMQSYTPDSSENKSDTIFTQAKAGGYQALQCQDGQKGYVLEMQDEQALDCSMSYENWLYTVNSSNVKEAAFEPDGAVTLRGKDMRYQITMVENAKQHPTSYYELRISGKNANKISARQNEEGYVIAGTDLHNVTVDALNDSKELTLTFSTDAQQVLIQEMENQALTVSADLDGNGTFETSLATALSPEPGDVNGDGSINAKDVTEILIASARTGTGKDSGLNDEQQNAADVNHDGVVNAVDATWILRYAAAVGTGSVQDGLDAFLKSKS